MIACRKRARKTSEMKHVNNHISTENLRKTSTKRRTSQRRKIRKKAVVNSARQMNKSSTKANPIPEIPGVDFLSKRELPSKRMCGIFYTDQIDQLVQMARVIRSRAKQGMIFIAPVGDEAFSIFKRKAVRA